MASILIHNPKTGLRNKSLIFAFLCALILGGYFSFYSLPKQEKHAIETLTKSTINQLETLSTLIREPLLKEQYSIVYADFDAQLANNSHWKQLTLTNHMGEQLYPSTKTRLTTNNWIKKLTHQVTYQGENLGEMTLVVNYKEEVAFAKNQQYKLIIILSTLLGILLIGWIVFIEKTMTKPLQHLVKAFEALSKLDYQYKLPPQTEDEIGQTIAHFSSMRQNLFSYQNNLVELNEKINADNEKLVQFSRIFHETHDGIIITDNKGAIINVNPAFTEITGYSEIEIQGKNPSVLSSGKHDKDFYKNLWDSVNNYGFWRGEIWNRKKSGELYAELISISSIKDENGNITHYVGVFSDITSRKRHQDELQQLAHYDILTKLPNRVLFADRFNQAVYQCQRTNTLLAICYLDVDNFKPINDIYGHQTGDQLLVEVASRIQNGIRGEDTVSRYGGDEFVFMLTSLNNIHDCDILIQRLIRNLSKPYKIDGQIHHVSASIGITLYPNDNQSLDTLLRHADQAMYQAKHLGRAQYQYFNTRLDKKLAERSIKLEQIRNALEKGQMTLYYQPKVNMVSGDVYGAEALIRWISPKKGLIPPNEFLPVLLGTPLEAKLDQWVFEQALKQLETWQTQNISLSVSINISPNYLQSSDFLSDIRSILEKYPAVDSTKLQFEVLESTALSDTAIIGQTIRTCQSDLGIKIALDDFGTGYASLTHLRELSVDVIKIDQSFVRDMLGDPVDFSIVSGVISLADAFNIGLVAEGVETLEQGLALITMGCPNAQGYFISKPLPVDQFTDWLSRYEINESWCECARNVLTRQQREYKLISLVTDHWCQQLEDKVFKNTEDSTQWPIIDAHYTHTKYWVRRMEKEGILNPELLSQFKQAFKSVYIEAQNISELLQQDKMSEMEQNIERLKSAKQQLQKLLNY